MYFIRYESPSTYAHDFPILSNLIPPYRTVNRTNVFLIFLPDYERGQKRVKAITDDSYVDAFKKMNINEILFTVSTVLIAFSFSLDNYSVQRVMGLRDVQRYFISGGENERLYTRERVIFRCIMANHRNFSYNEV